MTQYRVRLHSERVIGPLNFEDLIELKKAGKIEGNEEVQVFPTGDWKAMGSFPELIELSNVEESEEDAATFIRKINLEELREEVSKVDQFPKKFEYEKKTPFSSKSELIEDEDAPIEDSPKVVANTESTVIKISPKQPLQDTDDKTKINTNTLKYLEELKLAKQKALEDEIEHVDPEPEVDLDSDATQIISLDALKELKETEVTSENEFAKEKESFLIEKKETENRLKQSELKANEEEDQELETTNPKRKKMLLILVVIAIAYVVLFPAEEKKNTLKKVVLKEPRIEFPIRYEQPDKNKALLLYKEGLVYEKEGSYLSEIKSGIKYKLSAENQFNSNPALARLIFIYSRHLKNSTKNKEDANTIFKLVQIFKTKALIDPNFAAAVALFYIETEKYTAAVNTIEKYNAIKKSNPTVELFAVYLDALIKTGDLIKARAVAEKIETVDMKSRSIYVHLTLINYYTLIGNLERPSQIVTEARKIFKRSVSLNLERAKLLFYNEDFKSLKKLLRQLRSVNLGGSKVYYAKYLEYMGLLSAKEGNEKKAEYYFDKALKTHESLELRSRLAELFVPGASEQNSMVAESKAIQLIANSKLQAKKGNWKFAFKDALEANRIAPNFIPAKIYLTKLQINQSIFKEAIETLEELYDKNSKNPEIVFTLIDAYIESYKFTDVQRLLTILNSSELRNYPEYTSLTAKYYIYREDFASSVAWLQRAINKDPLNDKNQFELAKMYIKYNKFNRAKTRLNKAMDLDPANTEYRVAYSKILYEVDGASFAIGYLYDVLQDFPDNGRILSQIGISYYRSGQIKSFEGIKEKLRSIPNKDTTLYEFLIEAAVIDGKPQDQIEYSQKLIEQNPGDLKTRLNLGKIYMSQEKYKKALNEFKAIEDRLETYPMLQLYMANLYMLTDNLDKATELAMKEVKANSSSELGYILLGDIYSRKKEYVEAENSYKKAQKINGENVDMLLGLAKINFKKSQYDLTLDLFLKARENAPERAEIHKLLGDAYRKMGQSSLAIESYKLFLELSPVSKYKDEINTYVQKMQ
jgi:tetratricopeptide (TPR) repeat protein